jgi:hypothetical protein
MATYIKLPPPILDSNNRPISQPPHPLDIIGPSTFKASSYEMLQIALADIREFVASSTDKDVVIISIMPIPTGQRGFISGKVKTDLTTTHTDKTPGATSYQDRTTGPIELDGPLELTFETTSVQYIIFYEVSQKDD